MSNTLEEVLRLIRIYVALPFLFILLVFLLLYILIGGEDAIRICKKILGKLNAETE